MATILDRIRKVVDELKARGKTWMTKSGSSQQEGEVDEALIPLEKVSKCKTSSDGDHDQKRGGWMTEWRIILLLVQELQGALDQLRSLKQQQQCTPKDLQPVREVLGHIDSLYSEGSFRVEGVEGDPHGK